MSRTGASAPSEVVGLYGDPQSTWGIAAVLDLEAPVDPDRVLSAAQQFPIRFTHIGQAPTLTVSDDEADWLRAAQAPYDADDPTIRLLLSCDGSRLGVAAHHGSVDGLGLLGVAREVCGLDLRSSARGIGDRRGSHGFVTSSARRLAEAVTSKTLRFAGAGEPGATEENLTSIARPASPRGTGSLAAAVTAAYRSFHRAPSGQVVLAVGASRRTEPTPLPDRKTAFIRLRVPPTAEEETVRSALAATAPEPDFPETSVGGIGPLVTGLMRRRLGATATLSNLGVISGGVRSVAMYPAVSGYRAVGVGLASTPTETTLTLRTRRSEFTLAEHDAVLAAIDAAF